MPQVDLNTLLDLVGELTDSTDPGGASERFRRYLGSSLTRHTDVRAYVEGALAQSGDRYNRALQDLMNHVGALLGFDVEFGRYRGVRNEVGFDGIWRSPDGWSIVVECKTTDVYTIKTATLLGYINTLVSDGKIKDPSRTLGLYVYGRFDAQASQLENAIIAEARRDRLRVISAEALLNLLELMQEYHLSHDRVLNLLLPAPVQVDGIVNLIYGIVAKEREYGDALLDSGGSHAASEISQVVDADDSEVADTDDHGIHQGLQAVTLLGQRVPVSSWRAALLAVASMLYRRDRTAVEGMAGNLGGRKRTYLAFDTGTMRAPMSVPGSQLYIETHFSAASITRLCYRMLQGMGISASELEFEVSD